MFIPLTPSYKSKQKRKRIKDDEIYILPVYKMQRKGVLAGLLIIVIDNNDSYNLEI